MGQTTFTGPVISQNGFIDASFTTAERDAIVDPQPGLLIYNTTVNQYQVYSGTAWNYAFGDGVPNITSISPSTGAAGVTVTITGTGFSDVTSVTFDATPATSFTVVSSTEITAVVPAGTGAVDVTVTDIAGSSTEVNGFTYATAGTTFYVGTDYANNGVALWQPNPGDGTGSLRVNTASFTNPANAAAILALGVSAPIEINVQTGPDTSATFGLTIQSAWTVLSGTIYQATLSTLPPETPPIFLNPVQFIDIAP